MKKFMLLTLAMLLLSGCASKGVERNPHFEKAEDIAITATAAATGYRYGGTLWAFIAGIFGHEFAKGLHYRPGDNDVEYIDVPAGYSSGYSSCGAVRVYCDTTPKQGMYPPRPGMCNDPDSGGEATYEDLVRRAERRAGCYDNSGHHPHHQQHASYAPAQVVYPQNLWERPEKRQKTAEKKEPYDGPTVSDYMSPKWESAIPPDCRTGNYGRDSNCLYSEAEKLKTKQEACEIDSKKCKPGFNFGQMAWYDRKLAGDLRRIQDKYKE